MSWQLFKQNMLLFANNPEGIPDIATVAKKWATEYDMAVKRGGDTINHIAVQKGNIDLLEQLILVALEKGVNSTGEYDLVGEMGKAVQAYWQGATLNNFPIAIIPAVGSIQNIATTSANCTNPGQWQPPTSTPAQPSTQELLNSIPDDNNTVDGAKQVVAETGVEVLSDGGEDEGEQLQNVKENLPPDEPPTEPLPEEEAIRETESDTSNTVSDNNVEPIDIKCGVSGIDYDAQLTQNYKLRDLSIGCIFAHKIKAQVGLTEQDIICNLQNLAFNIIEPLKAKYPNMRVNSAFRGTPSIPGGVSQHQKGEAVDVQFIGVPPRGYVEIANWCKVNLPFDQMIFEHGNSIWLHISCKKNGIQRKQLLTMYKGKYQHGLICYYS